ncbi:protein prenylyltransferase [Hesseltinella vesiculosa]|uniref:Protein farnesyltransferase/geranylgeranyltransferase type-1 subunit alpha n=1 Tax=Hesseltinella vesiculosa TaxID=101127 RepID=A0A1X2GR41_9FUNG|nr:protein prenylyltransferase [Hesseltinella vesiculosa]
MEIPYSQRPEWSDVTPIPQDDGPNPLVPIAYAPESDIIDMNPAHYTIWQYRQQVLFALHADMVLELNYLDDIAENQVKNYQVWHHRQVIVDALGNGDREIPFINGILEEDSKNYHAWSYRQWVVKRFSLWLQDWTYTDDMITLDLRNNSAWNYRYFLLFSSPEQPTEDTLIKEVDYTKNKIPLTTLGPFLQELLDEHVAAPQLFSTWIDLYIQEATNTNQPINPKALEYCDRLADELDPIRKKYWAYKKSKAAELK